MSLLERMAKAGSVKATTLEDSFLFNKKDKIPTGIPIIDAAFSGSFDGGLVSGLTVLAGPSKHFKSNLGLVAVSAYMKKYKDAVCLFYDSEFGITPEYLIANGIDTSRVLHIPLEHIEQLKFDIVKRLEEVNRGDKVVIFVDSLGNLASKKEVEDAMDEKSVADMSRAKAVKSLFRIITPHLTTKDLPCIVINHTYQEMGLFPKQIVSGGCLIEGTELQLSDGTLKEIQDILPGEFVKTLLGDKEVTHSWNPETLENGTPECYEIEFEDGYKIICSENHKFLINNDWIEAKKLKENDKITVS